MSLLASRLTDLDDSVLVARARDGDQGAFRVLVQRHTGPIYRHATAMTGSPDVAEDIVQIAFVKAYQRLDDLQGRFDAWVFRIAANQCKDWLKNVRRKHVSYEEDTEMCPRATPEHEVLRSELGVRLDEALARLPRPLREAFLLKHAEGLSYEEMATRLDTTVGALKMRVHRAREALQRELAPYVDVAA